ncbi:MAG: DISARM system phospholipase D-like protein DrmC [Verrucomicrobiales bacterium]|nr:DISARM system phospholipase D-like protein DrmC [Verrucomicrobiales bacterium]
MKADAFASACSELVGQVATNPPLADAIVAALASEKLTRDSGPMGINNALKGYSGNYSLRKFLKVWGESAAHLDAQDVTATVKAALACYRLAQKRAHTVDTVWTGPEVARSEVRRTEAVVSEIVAGAERELLVVGYWLVTSAVQVRELIDLLIVRARAGVQVRFVFDPGEKSSGPDNFAALAGLWPADLADAKREVYSWSDKLSKATAKSGQEYNRKLHAKVIVADRMDALVTSANLTQAGLLVNLEMGLRVQGVMAGALVNHFDLLIGAGVLEAK